MFTKFGDRLEEKQDKLIVKRIEENNASLMNNFMQALDARDQRLLTLPPPPPQRLQIEAPPTGHIHPMHYIPYHQQHMVPAPPYDNRYYYSEQQQLNPREALHVPPGYTTSSQYLHGPKNYPTDKNEP